MINKLKKKKKLSKFFDIKALSPAEQILSMKIVHDKKGKKLWMSQDKHVEWVIKQFNMENAKPSRTPLANHFKLSRDLVLLQGRIRKRWQ